MSTRDLARLLLAKVNEKKASPGIIDIPFASAHCDDATWTSFFDCDSKEKVGRLAEEVEKELRNWLESSVCQS